MKKLAIMSCALILGTFVLSAVQRPAHADAATSIIGAAQSDSLKDTGVIRVWGGYGHRYGGYGHRYGGYGHGYGGYGGYGHRYGHGYGGYGGYGHRYGHGYGGYGHRYGHGYGGYGRY